MIIDKEIFGYLSLLATLVGSVPYIISILRGKTKPHIFTYIIWGAMTAIAGAAQYSAGAGPGAWATILAAAFCFVVVALSWRHGEKNSTRGDWASLVVGLGAIPVWAVTSNPLWAVIIVTAIDAVGYYPTFRKSYIKPHEEMPMAYVISNFKHALSILAVSTYSVATLLYPVMIFMMNCFLVGMLLLRRRMLQPA